MVCELVLGFIRGRYVDGIGRTTVLTSGKRIIILCHEYSAGEGTCRCVCAWKPALP